MKRKILIVLSLVLCIVVSLVAFAYPTVGRDPEITTTTTCNSGSFTNYHFPNSRIIEY